MRFISCPWLCFTSMSGKDSALFEDRRGGEFDDLRAAWVWALHDARSMLAEEPFKGSFENAWIEIHDAAGANVATLPFSRLTTLH